VARAIAATNHVVCTSCSQQCGLLADIADGRVMRRIGDRSNRASRGFICPKGAKAPLLHEHPHRLYVPLKIAATVQRITASHGSEALAYSDGTMRARRRRPRRALHVESLNVWLTEHARQAAAAGSARVFVTVDASRHCRTLRAAH
jgi:Molybdopterin oxidoreductase Fe4S4 domain